MSKPIVRRGRTVQFDLLAIKKAMDRGNLSQADRALVERFFKCKIEDLLPARPKLSR